MAKKYKWDNPLQWLCEYLASLPADRLFNEAIVLAAKLDSDTIQDLYESDMTADGYFEPLADA